MTKYSPEFKAQVVVEYMTDGLSSYTLEKKYKVSARQIRKWIQQYQLQGIKSFKQHHRKRIFSAKFKWHVINYYQTHAESFAQVAAKFDLLPSQLVFGDKPLSSMAMMRLNRIVKVGHKK